LGRAVSVYMPGRLRTGSSPVKTSMADALYVFVIIEIST